MPALSGGAEGTPGEISLAHLGVLFLDELPEFQRAVSIRFASRSTPPSKRRAGQQHVTFPARVQLIAAMNRAAAASGRSPLACVAPRARRRLSGQGVGPLLDRIDLHVESPASAPPI